MATYKRESKNYNFEKLRKVELDYDFMNLVEVLNMVGDFYKFQIESDKFLQSSFNSFYARAKELAGLVDCEYLLFEFYDTKCFQTGWEKKEDIYTPHGPCKPVK